jgi:hypothetical protein
MRRAEPIYANDTGWHDTSYYFCVTLGVRNETPFFLLMVQCLLPAFVFLVDCNHYWTENFLIVAITCRICGGSHYRKFYGLRLRRRR